MAGCRSHPRTRRTSHAPHVVNARCLFLIAAPPRSSVVWLRIGIRAVGTRVLGEEGDLQGGGGISHQVTFAAVKFRGAPWMLCITPRQSPQCVLPVCEKFAENPEPRVGNFAVDLNREISHVKFKCHKPPPLCTLQPAPTGPLLRRPCPHGVSGGRRPPPPPLTRARGRRADVRRPLHTNSAARGSCQHRGQRMCQGSNAPRGPPGCGAQHRAPTLRRVSPHKTR